MKKLDKENKSQIQLLADKIAVLHEKIKSQEEHLDNRQDAARRLEAKLINLGQEKDVHLKDLKEQKSLIEEKDNQINNLRESLEKAHLNLAQSKKGNEQLQFENAVKRKELKLSFDNEIIKLSNEKDRIISKLEAEIDLTSEKMRTLNEVLLQKKEEQKLIEASKFEKETQITRLKSTIQEKEGLSTILIADKEELQAKLSQKEDEIRLLNEEKDSLNIENHQKLEEYKLLNEKMESFQTEHQKKLSELRFSSQKIKLLQTDNDKKHELLTSEILKTERLQQALDCLSEKFQSLQSENQILNETLNNTNKETLQVERYQQDLHCLTEKLKALQNENQILTETLKVTKKETLETEGLQQDLHCLTGKLKALQNENQTLNETLKTTKKEILEVEGLQQDLHCLTEKLESLQTENQILNETIKNTKKNNFSRFSPIREIPINDCESFDKYLRDNHVNEEIVRLVSRVVEEIMERMGEVEGRVTEKVEEMERKKGRVGEMTRLVGVKVGLMEKNLKKTLGKNFILNHLIFFKLFRNSNENEERKTF